MPRYFFHTANNSRTRDEEGTDLPDLETARKAAVKLVASLVDDNPDLLWDGRDFRIEVTDESDLLLFTILLLAIDSPASR